MSPILCPSCGSQNSEQARFCVQCGEALEPPEANASAELKCPRCHKPVRAAAHFCPSCGYDLTQPIAADQTTSSEPTGRG